MREDRGTAGDVDFLAGGGEMGHRMRAMDWSRTAVGPIETWPHSLEIVVRIMLTSRYAMWLGWGPDLTFFCNDAYLPTLGVKQSWALGASARTVWAEIWQDIGPRAERVLETGTATWDEGLLLFLERRGFPEETYHTFSYSPVPDDRGGVGGMLCVVQEDTERTIGERRLRTLRALSAATATAKSAEAACQVAVESLAQNPHDLPFVLVYLLDETGTARLVAWRGLEPGSPPAPRSIGGGNATTSPWPLGDIAASHRPPTVVGLTGGVCLAPPGPWPEPVGKALVLPLNQSGLDDRPAGFFIAGVSPRRPLDDDYQAFVTLVAGQVSSAIAEARAFEEERRRAEALAALDRAKTAFFSNVSHEFRTPLTLMLGPLEDVLTRDTAVTAGQRDLLTIMHRNGLRLLKLVNTLLEFSRIEAGRMEASYQPVDLAARTAELASVFRSAVERAGMRLVVECSALPEPAFVDPDMWEKIVLNLVSNAFKFTLHGEIRVTLHARNGRAVLAVADTGTGIPSVELDRIFDRFHRVQGAQGRTHEGTGIGLALVQELVKLHGGTIGVESEEGRGTIFTLTIPLGSAHLPPDRLEVERTTTSTAIGAGPFVDEALRWLPDGDVPTPVLTTAVDGYPVPAARPGTARATVVLADDNADMREYVRRLLAADYDVVAVADGLAALDAARDHAADLVLTDVMMPKLDGLGLLHRLREDPRTAAIPVVMLSARAGEEARVEGLGAGADDYLIKPFSARELLARVGGTLALARVRREALEREAELRAEMVRVLESITDGFVALDRNFDFTDVNPQAERLLRTAASALVGTSLWEAFPPMLGTDIEHECRRAMSERIASKFETFYAPWARWFEVDAYPTKAGLALYLRDITDRKATVAALHDADRRKDEFLALLAHELRNPLVPLRNGLEVMKLAGAESDAASRARNMMDRQLSHMVRLIDDLLDISRITRNKLALRCERVTLADVVASALETARPVIEGAGHELVVRLPPEPVLLDADVTRLAQVLGNLLINSAKYTPAPGRITLTAEPSDTTVAIAVRDTGIGIPREALPSIFDMFSQVDRSVEQSSGGLGIGLAIVKALVEMHQGTVEADSDGPDAGSVFVVRLPTVHDPGAVDARVPATARPAAGRALRVLVVDDNRDSAESMKMMLSLLGNEVRTAHDGLEAMTAVAAFDPELVFMDLGMPRMNGLEATRRLRDTPRGRAATIIAVTGWGQEADRLASHQAGCDGHLIKPVDPASLAALINTYRETTATSG